MLANKLLGAAKVAGAATFVEDVFSTWLYTGNSSAQTITNGIDLSTKGGLVWTKARDIGFNNALFDTVNGVNKYLVSNSTNASVTQASSVTSFNTNGFSIGTASIVSNGGSNFCSWTFRKQAKFFDVVTYTGTGFQRTVNHNLGSVPGMIIVKRTTTSGYDWCVYHRSMGSGSYGYLNLTDRFYTDSSTFWASVDPTSTQFTVSNSPWVSDPGATYVAYLFAHDAGGFGASGSDNVISCGSYTGTGAAGNDVNLGFEPQWLMVKRSSSTGNWVMLDVMRGFSESTDNELYADLSLAEGAGLNLATPKSTGFQLQTSTGNLNASGSTYIYIAIRRPMKTPTSGTSVFNTETHQGTEPTRKAITTNFPVDLALMGYRNLNGAGGFGFYDRLRGGLVYLYSPTTDPEGTFTGTNNYLFDSNTSFTTGTGAWNNSSYTVVSEAFRRAPGFFDIVCDTGTASGHTINHGLTVVPELMIRKKRNSATNSDWVVWHTAFTGTNKYLYLNSTAAEDTNAAFWTTTAPTSTVFSVGTGSRVNNSGDTYVTYLFATVAGVSKVGSYTGTGTTLTIDCGFTAGARFVLIKRTSSTGDWYVWDTARGIISGNDPYLLLNSTAAEVTNTDYIDPVNSGFQISSTAPVQINQSGGTFIFLAIA